MAASALTDADEAMIRARDLDGLPERIVAVRHRLGLSQRALAARAGIARNAVLRYGEPIQAERPVDPSRLPP